MVAKEIENNIHLVQIKGNNKFKYATKNWCCLGRSRGFVWLALFVSTIPVSFNEYSVPPFGVESLEF